MGLFTKLYSREDISSSLPIKTLSQESTLDYDLFNLACLLVGFGRQENARVEEV